FHGRINHPRIDLLYFRPWKAHAIDGAGGEVLDHDIALLDQFCEDPGAGSGLRIQRDASFVGVQHREIQAVDTRNIAQLSPCRITFAGPLDLDDVGAEPRQDLSARRPRLHVRHIQNPNTLESFPHAYLSSITELFSANFLW